MEGEDFVLPTAEGGGFASLTASATELLNKVNTMPFDQIGKNLDGILKSVNDDFQGSQMKRVLTELAGIIASAQNMVQNLNSGLSPAAKQLPEMAAGPQKTLANANKLVLSLDNGYGDNTKFNRDLERLLVQANDSLARSARSPTSWRAIPRHWSRAGPRGRWNERSPAHRCSGPTRVYRRVLP
jgi:paraquat-inducible protein B